MNWEIDGVSKSEKYVTELLAGDTYAHPMGVIVFGADSGLKAKAYRRIRGKLKQPLTFDRASLDGYVGQIKTAFDQGHSVLVCMSGADSVHHGERHQLVKRLYGLGAASVITVFAKATENDSADFGYLDRSGLKYSKYLRHINKLLADPPTYGGVDGFITVRSPRRPRSSTQ